MPEAASPPQTGLDKFYTRPHVVTRCLEVFSGALGDLGIDAEAVWYLEPSAGSGAFCEPLWASGRRVVAVDLAPEGPGIDRADFLAEDISGLLPSGPGVVIGNPPYGKRSRLALEFVDRALSYAPVVGFILPIQFDKYLTQKNIRPDARLMLSERLPDDAFTDRGKVKRVRSVFQVWTTLDVDQDLRIRTAPLTSHPDFVLNTYNCTPQCEWMLDAEFDFAVLRQGWGRFTPVDHGTVLDRRKQWMTFSADDPAILDRLRRLDFDALGERNTSVRGFGKADVVAEYTRLYGGSGDS